MTIDEIDASSDDELFVLLKNALEQQITAHPASPEFITQIRGLPVGLRAMAATHQLDVSLTLDDLGWHFGNWHSLELAEETALGFDELKAVELAMIFREAFRLAQNYWTELGTENWTQWYHGSEFQQVIKPIDEKARCLLDTKKRGLFDYWLSYARHFPERVGAIET